MRIVNFLVLTWAVILSCTDPSLQSKVDPISDKIPDLSNPEPSTSTGEHQSPVRSSPPARTPTAAGNSVPSEPFLRARSRSPPDEVKYRTLLGMNIGQLQYYRLFPINRPNRELELRTYTFPPGAPIHLRERTNNLKALPRGKQIVLSTVDGDILAIVEKTRHGHTVLRGLYVPHDSAGIRAKMNMVTQHVTELDEKDMNDTPLGTKFPIRKWFNLRHVDPDKNFSPPRDH